MENFINTIHQINPLDNFRIVYSAATEYTDSFQVYMQHLPRQTISRIVTGVPINFREFSSYKVSSLTTVESHIISKDLWKILM